MTDEELIEQARAALEKRGFEAGRFWHISRLPGSFTNVWFWRVEPDPQNHSCQFDEQQGLLLWCY